MLMRPAALDQADGDRASWPAGEPRAPGDGTLGRADVLLAGLLALAAMAVALVFRSAIVPTDPWHYVQGALAFPDGGWRPEGLSRWGYLLPIIPFARLWGDATATYYAVPLLCTGVLAGVLFLLGTRLVGRVAGLLGAVLALATPLVFVNLTRGYTDLAATTLVGLAILLATLARDAARDTGRAAGAADAAGATVPAPAAEARWGWRVPLLLVATGFVTGWSFEVRETAIFAWPVIGWILWQIGRPLRTLAWCAPPALAWLVLDILLCAWVYGDPLLKLRYILGADIASSEVLSDAGYVGQSRWWYATVLPRSIWEVSGGPALLAALLVGLIGGFVLRRRLGTIWAWGALTLLLLWAQGGPLDPAHPSVRLDVARYWLSFIVPLLLTAACVLVLAVRAAHGWLRVGAVLATGALTLGILVPSARFATTYPGFAPNGGDAMAQLRTHLARTGGLPGSTVWADWGTNRILPIYQAGPFGAVRWRAEDFRAINRLARFDPETWKAYPRPGDAVVVYSPDDRTCWHCRRAGRDAQALFGTFPQAGWVEEFRSRDDNLILYRLGPSAAWPRTTAPAAGAGTGTGGEDGGDPGL